MSDTPAIPKPSASVMLLRDGAEGIEVLMMRRAKTMGFAAGAIAFPGGGLEEDKDGNPESETAYRHCALREIEEEIGIQIEGPDALRLYARWITPEFVPKRFDTWFYLAKLPEGQEPKMVSTEMDELYFDTVKNLLDKHIEDIMLPTQMNLRGLNDFDTVDAAMEAAGDPTGQPLMPKMKEIDGKPMLLIPEQLGGGTTEIPKFLRRS